MIFQSSLSTKYADGLFKTLKAAKEAAKKETGVSVAIYTNFPYGRTSEIVCFADASGFTPS